jgi:hypothetical protein
MSDWAGFSLCVICAKSSSRRYTSDLSLDGAVQADVAESSRPELSRSPRDGLYKSVSGWVGWESAAEERYHTLTLTLVLTSDALANVNVSIAASPMAGTENRGGEDCNLQDRKCYSCHMHLCHLRDSNASP